MDATLREATAAWLRDPRVDAVAVALRQGRLSAFPTETVFALAADLRDSDAVAALYAFKRRSQAKPLALLVADIDMARRVALFNDRAQRVAESLWPGPLTLVLPAAAGLQTPALAGGRTIGLRCPAHPLALAIVHRSGGALAATSLNAAGSAPALTAREARVALANCDARCDAIVMDDAPPAPSAEASTVVVLGGCAADDVILRAGAVTGEQISFCAP